MDSFCYLSDRSSDIARKEHVDACELKSSAIELKVLSGDIKARGCGFC